MAERVHLHLHTLYSLLDGAIRIKDLLKTLQAKGMNTVALDRGNTRRRYGIHQAGRDPRAEHL